MGVTGGIAAYKSAELARIFVREGKDVQVIMTPGAVHFVNPLTFETLTGRRALVEQFELLESGKVRHVDLGARASVLVVAPATANTIAGMAAGIADNLLTAVYLAAQCPVVIVPSMNEQMYLHPAVQFNLERLRECGCRIMEPDTGELACGSSGKGRMPEPAQIADFVRAVLGPKDFQGIRAMVTAGPTQEPLDPVRFISNHSTGRMGYALARALGERGAAVVLISGPTALSCPRGAELVPVTTAREMYAAVMKHAEGCNLIVKAAAVADYRPAEKAKQKLKKGALGAALELLPNPDILQELGRRKGGRVLVGFAMETEDAAAHARRKLEQKNLDFIVVNDLTVPGAGFAFLTNKVSIINRAGEIEDLPLMSKEILAHRILDRIRPLISGKGSSRPGLEEDA